MLRSLQLNVFAKSATCPSAEGLLAFSRAVLAPAQTHLVAAHLQECDFCGAELQLLERYPCQAEVVPAVEIPPDLRLLAESILGSPPTTRPPRSFESWREINH
jgi:hypothetical protein